MKKVTRGNELLVLKNKEKNNISRDYPGLNDSLINWLAVLSILLHACL